MFPMWGRLPNPLDLLFPPLCVLCTAPLDGEKIVCGRCLGDLSPTGLGQWREQVRIHDGLDEVWSAYWFDEQMKALIHTLKYEGLRGTGHRLGEGVSNLLGAECTPGQYDLLIPIPLHWNKRRRRGYNQAEVLANRLGQLWGIAIGKRCIVRRRPTQTQTGLSVQERRANVAGCFRVTGKGAGLNVLLVDDVLTTGATASACGLALKEGGYGRVSVITVATPPKDG